MKIGDEVAIKNQEENELFIVSDIRENGYVTVLKYKVLKQGKLTNTGRSEIVPRDDVIGVQTKIIF